jgi:predicted kinase
VQVIVMIGLQGAGKTTFSKSRFAPTHDYVSRDYFRHNKRPRRRQRELIVAALEAGRSVVVDNTNPTPEDRAEIIAVAREFGAETIGYYFASGIAENLERNNRRSGKERVPEIALYATAARLVRPRAEEGFDRLYYVRPLPEGEFEVCDWIEDEGVHEDR